MFYDLLYISKIHVILNVNDVRFIALSNMPIIEDWNENWSLARFVVSFTKNISTIYSPEQWFEAQNK